MAQRVISFHYILTNAAGDTLDSSRGDEPMTYLEGGEQIIPGLEKELGVLKVKDKKKVTILSAEAYGPRNEQMVMDVPLEKLPAKDVKVGDQFQVESQDNQSHPVMVVNVTDTHVTLDANHPLAGMDLTFDVEMIEIRDATLEEITHGHAHGAGGHSH